MSGDNDVNEDSFEAAPLIPIGVGGWVPPTAQWVPNTRPLDETGRRVTIVMMMYIFFVFFEGVKYIKSFEKSSSSSALECLSLQSLKQNFSASTTSFQYLEFNVAEFKVKLQFLKLFDKQI